MKEKRAEGNAKPNLKQFICSIHTCKREFKNKANLTRHKKYHGTRPSINKKIKCK